MVKGTKPIAKPDNMSQFQNSHDARRKLTPPCHMMLACTHVRAHTHRHKQTNKQKKTDRDVGVGQAPRVRD